MPMAFYHTYRPQNFADISQTQHAAAELLVSSLLSEKLGHAYLFTGSHGIGKTSSARILAKAINCEKYASLEFSDKIKISEKLITSCIVPCNECSACMSITSGSAVDVVEMDAASNRGIDDMRELRERVRLLPAALNKKVYIIDEVHMLTTEAFNALLKTLEEPPKHCVFILCTTDKEKVPMTIQSRCTSVVFQRPTSEIVVGYLQYMAKAEKLKIDDESLQFIARLSKGAFRDAAKYLEQASLLPQPITRDVIEKQFIGTENNSMEIVLGLIAAHDLTGLLKQIQVLESNHVQFSEFMRELIDHLRMILLYKAGVVKKEDLAVYSSFNPDEFCKSHEINFMSEAIEGFMKALGQQKTTPMAAIPFELACIKLLVPASPNATVSVQRVVSPPPPVAPKEAPKKVELQPEIQETKPAPVPVVEENIVMVEELIPVKTEIVLSVSDEPVGIEVIQQRWGEVVRLIKKYNASMAMLMLKCRPVKLDGKIVTVETNYSFHKDMLESPKNRPVIEQAIYELLGAQLRVKGALSNSKIVAKQVENVKEVANEDLVAAVQEIFGA